MFCNVNYLWRRGETGLELRGDWRPPLILEGERALGDAALAVVVSPYKNIQTTIFS